MKLDLSQAPIRAYASGLDERYPVNTTGLHMVAGNPLSYCLVGFLNSMIWEDWFEAMCHEEDK